MQLGGTAGGRSDEEANSELDVEGEMNDGDSEVDQDAQQREMVRAGSQEYGEVDDGDARNDEVLLTSVRKRGKVEEIQGGNGKEHGNEFRNK